MSKQIRACAVILLGMGYFGGTRVAVLALVAFVIGLSLPATSVDSQDLKLAIAEPDSQVSSQQIMVCVSWDTKEIKYSKYWRFCPSKHASVMLGLEGPKGERGAPGPGGPTGATGARGPSGNTTSLGIHYEPATRGCRQQSRLDTKYISRRTGTLLSQRPDVSSKVLKALWTLRSNLFIPTWVFLTSRTLNLFLSVKQLKVTRSWVLTLRAAAPP